jgi:hypothetical protein
MLFFINTLIRIINRIKMRLSIHEFTEKETDKICHL